MPSIQAKFARDGSRSLRDVFSGSLCIVMLSVALLISLAAAGADAAVIAIARGGDIAPSSAMATFTVFNQPVVNGKGDVAFEATLSNGHTGIYLETANGTLKSIAQSGDTIDGAKLSTDFSGPVITNSGTVYFVNRGSTGSFTAALFMKAPGGNATSIIQQGTAAPGTTGKFDSFGDLSTNPMKGDVAVIGTYTEDSGSTFKVGLWLRELTNKSTGASQLLPIVLKGATLPRTGAGTVSGSTVDDLGGPWVSDNRVVAFAANNIKGGKGGLEGSIFASKTNGKIKQFVLTSDAPPTPPGGTILSLGIGQPGIVASTLAVQYEVAGGSTSGAIATKVLGAQPPKTCAMNGEAAPGTTGTFSTSDGVSPPSYANTGNLEFDSTVTGDATNFDGVFVCETKGKKRGTILQVVLAGDPKPGGGTWSNFAQGSSSAKFIAFLDDNSGVFDPSVGGVFRADQPSP